MSRKVIYKYLLDLVSTFKELIEFSLSSAIVKIAVTNILFTAKILQEAMCLTSPAWTKSLTIKILHHNAKF